MRVAMSSLLNTACGQVFLSFYFKLTSRFLHNLIRIAPSSFFFLPLLAQHVSGIHS